MGAAQWEGLNRRGSIGGAQSEGLNGKGSGTRAHPEWLIRVALHVTALIRSPQSADSGRHTELMRCISK